MEYTSRPQFLRGEGIVAGVAEGLARDFQVDLVLVRILWIVAFCLGAGVIAYILCWIGFSKQSEPTQGKRNRIMGVCWKVAERAHQPVGLIRLAALGLLLVSGGTAIVGYILALLILPNQPQSTAN